MERRTFTHVFVLAATAAVQSMGAAAATVDVPSDDGNGAARLAVSLERDKRLSANGVLPMFPLATEQRDIRTLLGDEAAFRAKVVSTEEYPLQDEPYGRCTSTSCKARALPENKMPSTLFSATIAGTPRSDPAPPLALGSLSDPYFETLAGASRDPAGTHKGLVPWTI